MAQIDLISNVFVHLLEDHHWIDIPSTEIQHTWKKNYTGNQSLARRLDRFLIKEAFHAQHSRSRQRVGNGGISNHQPIFLELDDTSLKIIAPFKFNSTWLKEPSYIKLVTKFWQSHLISEEADPAKGFVSNLKELNGLSIEWVHMKREKEDINLKQAE